MESQCDATSEFTLPGPPPTTLMTISFNQHGPYKESWPSHHYCELVYTLDGAANLAIDGTTYEARPGRVLLIKAKRPHSTVVADHRHLHGIVIHFLPNSLAAYVEHIEPRGRTLRVQRLTDNFLETLEMDLPGLITVTTQQFIPRYTALAGLQDSFEKMKVVKLNADDLDINADFNGVDNSPTRILDVYTPITEKKNIILKGTPAKIVGQIFEQFDDKIGGAIGKDLKVKKES